MYTRISEEVSKISKTIIPTFWGIEDFLNFYPEKIFSTFVVLAEKPFSEESVKMK